MAIRTTALTLTCLFLLAGDLTAQINPFGRQTRGLDATDIQLMTGAAAQLYKSSNPVVGASRTWANPASGNAGVVQVVGIRGRCVQLRHRIRRRGYSDPSNFVMSRCRTGNAWELR